MQFPDLEVSSESTKFISGFLEVNVNGKLIHSKNLGDGYVDTDEKYNNIVNAIIAAYARTSAK